MRGLNTAKIHTTINCPERKLNIWANGREVSYEVVGVIIHEGEETRNGHYVYNHYMDAEQKWVQIDDDKISLFDMREQNKYGTIFILEQEKERTEPPNQNPHYKPVAEAVNSGKSINSSHRAPKSSGETVRRSKDYNYSTESRQASGNIPKQPTLTKTKQIHSAEETSSKRGSKSGRINYTNSNEEERSPGRQSKDGKQQSKERNSNALVNCSSVYNPIENQSNQAVKTDTRTDRAKTIAELLQAACERTTKFKETSHAGIKERYDNSRTTTDETRGEETKKSSDDTHHAALPPNQISSELTPDDEQDYWKGETVTIISSILHNSNKDYYSRNVATSNSDDRNNNYRTEDYRVETAHSEQDARHEETSISPKNTASSNMKETPDEMEAEENPPSDKEYNKRPGIISNSNNVWSESRSNKRHYTDLDEPLLQKEICWWHKKGRCQFGDDCWYRHKELQPFRGEAQSTWANYSQQH